MILLNRMAKRREWKETGMRSFCPPLCQLIVRWSQSESPNVHYFAMKAEHSPTGDPDEERLNQQNVSIFAVNTNCLALPAF